MKHFSLVAAAMLAATTTALAQRSAGTITGTILNLPSASAPVRAELIEIRSGAVVQSLPVAAAGAFTFYDVPFASYRIQMYSDNLPVANQLVAVQSAIPVAVTMDATPTVQAREVVVTEDRISRDRLGTATFFTAHALQELPVIDGGKRIESALLATPGVVPDEDGRLHVRGEDAQLQYVVDGIPITTNLTRVYSSLFDANTLKAVNIQTGGLDARYGVAAAGVLAITTKSGFDAPSFLTASAGVGSYHTNDFSVTGGGNLDGQLAGCFTVSGSSSEHYLDPIAEGDPIHDDGDGLHAFGKINAILSNSASLSVLGAYNTTNYSIPNGKIATPAQDQRQELRDYMAGARLGISVGETAQLSLMAYHRNATAKATSGGLMRIATPQDSAKAVAENEKFFIGADRSNGATGGQLELTSPTDWFGHSNTLNAGIGGESFPLKEFFTFAVVNPALSDPNIAGGDNRYRPYDLTQGGTPFLVDQQKTGTRASAWIQDRIAVDEWIVNAGVRFDMFDLFEQEIAISPRLAASYRYNDQLVFRGSYGRIVMQAPIENILVSSSPQAQMLSGIEQGDVPTQVRSEKSHVIELGAGWAANEYLDVDVATFGKLIDDFIVKAELGNSGIIFPLNLKQGVVAGGEVRASLHKWHNLEGALSVSSCVALGMKPEDGSSPIAAGLIFGEEGHNYSHPFAGEDIFPTEHNQILTAVLNMGWHLPVGLFVLFDARFDSGLPFDLTDANGNGLAPEASRAELRARGYSDAVLDLLALESEEPGSPDKSVAPHATVDLAVGYEFQALHTLHGRLAVTATNLLDTPYLYKFESSFGGTHFGHPRMIGARVELGI
ncbi:MAG: TonB-dependent receptor [Armatimonadetes bacterium]|nr:TonB-dependent receptor [Armatimonadota bacterium]